MSDNGAAPEAAPAPESGDVPEPQLVPLNAIFHDDFVELLIPVMSNQTIAELAGAVEHHATSRVRARDARKVVYHDNRLLDDDLTVAEAGIAPLDHVRVDYADED